MSPKKRVHEWTKIGIINEKQGAEIILLEKKANKDFFWKTLIFMTVLFIGAGFCLLMAANWPALGDSQKLTLDFSIFGVIIFGALWSIKNKRNFLKELFLALSFLMTGVTIGPINKIFNLSGGWAACALIWSLLSLPFILISRLLTLNFIWLCVFFSMFNFGFFEKIIDYSFHNFVGFPMISLFAMILSYAGEEADKEFSKYTVLPKAFSALALICAYLAIFIFGIRWGTNIDYLIHNSIIHEIVFNLIVFLFLGAQMGIASWKNNMHAFRCNAILAEIYIIYVFCSRIGNLFRTGIGFIIGGIAIGISIYILRMIFRDFEKKVGAKNEK